MPFLKEICETLTASMQFLSKDPHRNARLENRKSSNGRKIARMARILTILGPKRSQRPKLFRTNETNKKFPKNSIKYQTNIEKF